SRKLPVRFGCKLAGRRERQLRTAKWHLVASALPDETKNPLTTAGRVNNEAQGQTFVLIYSRAQFLDFFLRKRLYRHTLRPEPVHFSVPSGRQPLIKAPYNHPMRHIIFSHQFANESVATRRVAELARLQHAIKIFARNFPSG